MSKVIKTLTAKGLNFTISSRREIYQDEISLDGYKFDNVRKVIANDEISIFLNGTKIVDRQRLAANARVENGKKIVASIGHVMISEESGIYPQLKALLDEAIAEASSPETIAIEAQEKAERAKEIAFLVAQDEAAAELEARITCNGRSW